MRNYIDKMNVGGAPDSIVSTRMGGGEQTSIMRELSNSVNRSGQTPAPADGTSEDTTQLSQALFINGTGASSFQDSGAENSVILTPISGTNGLQLPGELSLLNGAIVKFIPAAANTGAVTLNIGQSTTSLLGAKRLLNVDGSELGEDELSTSFFTECVYYASADDGNGAWIVSNRQAFDGAVRLVSLVSSGSSWVIQNLIPMRNLLITASAASDSDSYVGIVVTGGSQDANGGNIHRWWFAHTNDQESSTVPSFTVVPTESTVTFSTNYVGGGITLRAYQ